MVVLIKLQKCQESSAIHIREITMDKFILFLQATRK
jgi:hypothetical protein